MPKRRVSSSRTARQRAASRQNLVKAREARKTESLKAAFAQKMPQGKTVLLYHHTTPEKASKIMRSGFKPLKGKGIQNARKASGIADVTWFHDRTHHNLFADFAGNAVLTVKVPRKLVMRRQLGIGDELMVRHSDLAGRKIRRIK